MKTSVLFITVIFLLTSCAKDDSVFQDTGNSDPELTNRASSEEFDELFNAIPERDRFLLSEDARKFVFSKKFRNLSDHIANTNITPSGATKKWERTLEEYFEWSSSIVSDQLYNSEDSNLYEPIEIETEYNSFDTSDLSSLRSSYVMMNYRLLLIGNYYGYGGLEVIEVKVKKTSRGMKFKLVMEAR